MMMKKSMYFLSLLLLFSCGKQSIKQYTMEENNKQQFKVNKTDEEWKAELTEEQYYVLRQAGTERPYTGQYNMHFEKGVYTCAGCGEVLFSWILNLTLIVVGRVLTEKST